MANTALILSSMLAVLTSAVGVRVLDGSDFSGRQLLNIDVGTRATPFTALAGTYGAEPECRLNIGLPSSEYFSSDPKNVLSARVPVGKSLTIDLQPSGAHYISLIGITGAAAQTEATTSYAKFTPTAVGQTSTVYYSSTSGSPYRSCSFRITFTAVAPQCTGAVPCYCQNGYCFNNGATLTDTCAPPSGQTCSPVSINPSIIGVQYAGYSNPVNVCKCS